MLHNMLGFSCEKPVIGVIHLEPLPGSPCFDSMKSVLDSALKDAENLIKGGSRWHHNREFWG